MTQHPRSNDGQRPASRTQLQADQPIANIQAEEDALACLLQSPIAIDRVADTLTPEHFYRDAHRLIYLAIEHLYSNDRRINRLNVADVLRRRNQLDEIGGMEVLRHLEASTGSFERGGIEEAAQAVIDTAKFRTLRNAALEIFTSASNEEDDAVDRAVEIITRVALGSRADAIDPFSFVVDQTLANLRQRQVEADQQIARGLSSGYPELDRCYGGLQRGHLITLAALTGYGKSAFGWNVALNVALAPRQDGEQKHVYVATLEMSREELVERALAATAMVDHSLIRDGLLNAAQMRAVEAAAARLRQCNIWLDEDSITVQDIERQARRRHACGQLDLIVVDYLQLLESSEKSRGATRAQDLEAISRRLKRLAHDLDVPVIALVQLNRNVEEGQKPTLAHINESGGIARNSNVVILVYAEEDQLPLRRESDTFKMTFIVAKARSGRYGEVELTYVPRATRFMNRRPGEQQQEGGNEGDESEETADSRASE
jgi:replicative DNA helicase